MTQFYEQQVTVLRTGTSLQPEKGKGWVGVGWRSLGNSIHTLDCRDKTPTSGHLEDYVNTLL